MSSRLEAAQPSRYFGLVPAGVILLVWALVMAFLLTRDPGSTSWVLAWLCLPLATFLYTGLFITAHDAMHGTIAPGSRRLNDGVGALCAWLYALFSFRRLAVAHRQHHETPAIAGDPDWHDGRHAAFWPWYGAFMRRYVTWRQLAGMALAFQVLAWGLQIPLINLAVFWIVPNLLSTLQLFYFGTYRVHREPPGGHTNRHRATTSGYPLWLSFLTCYHFGLHLAHHEHPGIPWWRLPRAVKGPDFSS